MGYERKWIDDSDEEHPITVVGCAVLTALLAMIGLAIVIAFAP